MAINKISGNILQDNLQRGANLAIQGNLVYFDVTNNRVGILTESPAQSLDVGGNLKVGNVVVYLAGNVDVGNIWINNLQDPIVDADAATKKYVDSTISNLQLGNFSFTDTTISSVISPASITIAPTGNSEVIIDTNSGLVIPVGSSSERPPAPQTGTLRWNTDLSRAEIYDGAEWDQVASDVSYQIINPDGSSLSYALDRNTTAAAVLVITNGIVQTPAVAYSVTGNTLTFSEAPLTSDIIDIRFL
jgi:hypothetical protein